MISDHKKGGIVWRNPFGEQENRYDPEFREETHACSVRKQNFEIHGTLFDIFKVVVFSLLQETPKLSSDVFYRWSNHFSFGERYNFIWQEWAEFENKIGPKHFIILLNKWLSDQCFIDTILLTSSYKLNLRVLYIFNIFERVCYKGWNNNFRVKNSASENTKW